MKPFLPLCSSIATFMLTNGTAQATIIPSGCSVAPSGFEENKGQVLTTAGAPAPFVRYRLIQGNTNIFLLGNGIAYQFNRLHYPKGYEELEKDAHLDPSKQQELDSLRKNVRLETYRMDVMLEGADSNARVTTEGRSDDYTQYYNHNALDVHTYSRVTYHEVYPGIDWMVHTTEKGMEYDFVLRSGADPSLIQLRFKDYEELYVDADGQLIHGNHMGRFTEGRPVSFQNGRKVDSRFVLEGDRLRFALGAYDRSQPLTIDPARIWGTYYGGADEDAANSCAVDSSGNAYLAGSTFSTNAIAAGGHQNALAIAPDAFLVKFNANGVRQWGTYYGGGSMEDGNSCAVDASGNVYFAGTTVSLTAIASGGHQETFGGSQDAFLVKFNTDGVRQWGTYYGGTDGEYGTSCALDGSDNVYLAGTSRSTNAIAIGGYQNTLAGAADDAFLVKFDSSGVRLWGTYYGGTDVEEGHSCAVDGSGSVYLAGWTWSTNAIASEGHQDTYGGYQDAFLVKFNASGARQWGTYYGGTGIEEGRSCAVDGNDNVYLAGITYSDSGIASSGHQNTFGGGDKDGFLVKFNGSGVRQWGTYYGGANDDEGISCAVGGSGNVFLAGWTTSSDAIAAGGFQSVIGAGIDAFLVKFDPSGIRQWGTYYGGTQGDIAYSCALDDSDNVYLTGVTYSDNGIAFAGHQNTHGGGYIDAFLVKFDGLPVTNAGILSLASQQPSCSIWPNPSSGDRFFLQMKSTGPAEVQLFDALGQLQWTWHLQMMPGEAPVELRLGSDLAEGIYLVHCTVEGRLSTAPLIIQ